MNAEEIAVSSSPNYVYDRSQQSKILDLLVYKNFDQCIEECSRIVDNAMCLSTDERITSDECEWLCQVCIQAYAELNRWSEVLPLVTQLYNGIEDCPAKVFQSCLLLHASVKDFPTCSAICNIWLKNPNNFGKAEYKIIVELYIAKVLVVLDKWSDIGSFVEKCPGLSSEVQEGYKRHIKTLQRRKEQEEIDKIEEIKETDHLQETGVQTRNYEKQASNTSTHQTEGPVPQGSKLKAVMSKLDDIRRKLLLSNTSQFFQKLALIAFILYLLITKLNFDMLPNETVTSIYHTITGLWKAMFAPFHVARSV